MSLVAERGARLLHGLLALAALWLLATSPWVTMYSKLPRIGTSGTWANLAHLGFGVVITLAAVLYTRHCCREGLWRRHFPWLAGRMAPVGAELAALLRGRLPSAEGGALFPMIEGLLLLALLLAGAIGLAWLAVQGSPAAMAWADVHAVAARSFGVLLLLHVLAVARHLLDFVA